MKGFQHALTWNSLMKLTPCVEAVISTPLSLLLVLGTSYVSEHVESEHDRDHVYPNTTTTFNNGYENVSNAESHLVSSGCRYR